MLGAAAVVGQQPASAMTSDDFSRMFWKGWKTTGLAARQGLRYTETRGDWVLTVEADRSRSGRASYVNTASGVVDSECVVIGDRIYERRGRGQWTVRTRAEYMAEHAVLIAARDKARAEKDHRADERIHAEITVKARIAALNAQHVPWFGMASLMIFSNGFLDDRMITTSGWVRLNGRSVRMYKIAGVNNKLAPTVRGDVRKNRHENDYWFDEKTGAIAKARTRVDEFRGDRIVTNIVTYEWELDPLIEIKAPDTSGVTTMPRR